MPRWLGDLSTRHECDFSLSNAEFLIPYRPAPRKAMGAKDGDLARIHSFPEDLSGLYFTVFLYRVFLKVAGPLFLNPFDPVEDSGGPGIYVGVLVGAAIFRSACHPGQCPPVVLGETLQWAAGVSIANSVTLALDSSGANIPRRDLHRSIASAPRGCALFVRYNYENHLLEQIWHIVSVA